MKKRLIFHTEARSAPGARSWKLDARPQSQIPNFQLPTSSSQLPTSSFNATPSAPPRKPFGLAIRPTRWLFATLLLLTICSVSAQTTYDVTVGSGTGDGSLPWAIEQAAQGGTNDSVISIASDLSITMSSQQFISVSSLNIEGNEATIDMGGADRAFFIAGGNVTISDLTIENGNATGGAGGDGGGGGAGLGGAIFAADGENIPGSRVGNATTVTLSNIAFTNNQAVGGAGGTNSANGSGGGGGLGGAGGAGYFTSGDAGAGGGGGVGLLGFGGSSSEFNGHDGAAGIVVGAESGGNGDSSFGENSGNGGANGGGGGAGEGSSLNSVGGGGGVDGSDSSGVHNAGSGGFGGGGGGAAIGDYPGNGGFGGGGGAADADGHTSVDAGNGGFGGGGGGITDVNGYNSSTPGFGGFGGGNGGQGSGALSASGGGGLGAGGAIFATAGVNLTISDSSFGGDSVTGGASGGNSSTAGSAYGNGIFLGNATVFSNNGTMTISEDIAGTANSGTSYVGSGEITSAGSGMLILTGANTYAGGTIINAGSTIQVGNGGTNGQLGAGVVAVYGTLSYDLSDTFSEANYLTGNGGIQQNGTGTLILAGGANFTGSMTINNGTLLVGSSGGQLPNPTGNVVINSGGTIAFGYTGGSFTLSSQFTGSGTILQEGPGNTMIITQSIGSLNLGIAANSTVQVNNGGSLGGGPIMNNGTLTYNLSGTSVAGNSINGSGGIQQNGPGTLILTGDSAVSGATTIASGSTLQVGNGGTTGQLISSSDGGNGAIVNSGTLIFDRSDLALNYNAISGGGIIQQIGSGTLALVGPNTYTGGVLIASNSTLQVGDGGILGQLGSGDIVDNGTLAFDLNETNQGQFQQFTTYTVLSNISGTGGVLKLGSDTVVLAGSNSFTGPVKILDGTLVGVNRYALADATITNWSGIEFAAGITNIVIGGISGADTVALTNQTGAPISLTVGNNNDPSYSGNLDGTAVSLNKIGSAVLVMSGTNTYGGGTTITEGTLQFAQIPSMPASGTVVVNSNATLAVNVGGPGEFTTETSGNGSLGGIFSGLGGQSGSTVNLMTGSSVGIDTTDATNPLTYSGNITNAGLGLTKLGTGTLILTGANSYSGATLINAGQLTVQGTNSGGGAVTVTSGGTLGGNGVIGGATTIESGGALTPGSGYNGALTFTNGLTLMTGATTTLSLQSTISFTSINLIGSTIMYGGALEFNITSFTPTAGDVFNLFQMNGGATESGDFTSVQAGDILFTDPNDVWNATNNGLFWQFNESTGQLTINTVPEPSTYVLLGLGMLVLLLVSRRGISSRDRRGFPGAEFSVALVSAASPAMARRSLSTMPSTKP